MDVILFPLVFLVGAAAGAFLVWLTVKIKQPVQLPTTDAQPVERLGPGPFRPN